ncbi:MAG TPA: glucose-1-phosphate adenylyltransferase [Gammaproteobacteria bacterium]|nr:glucose-1-phosphate adenylyltransferase [Gammaproteobacteria bacterium]
MRERRQTEKVIAFVMAGGAGSRLHPLTAERCKPAVPFGGRDRLVDFVLSNLVNSGIRSIYLLVQYKPQSLIEHTRKAWVVSPLFPDQFVTVVPPQMDQRGGMFRGTADAVYQSLQLIDLYKPDLVAVFGADHIYRMDVRQMMWFHREHRADVSVAALPVPIEEASSFGIIDTDPDGRIREFQEKPERPKAMPGDPARAFVSMGNYLFSTDVLAQALLEAHARDETDFGHHVLPRLLSSHRLFAYDFSTNEVPGIKPHEEPAYWRDVGTIDAYFETHKDVLGIEPRFDAFNPRWPIFSSNYQGPVARVLGGEVTNCLLGAATVIQDGARLRNCIVRREAVVESGAELEDCIIMDYVRVRAGARLRRVIVDRHNLVEADDRIGFDQEEDARRFHLTPSGVVVVPTGSVKYYARDSREEGPGYAE